MENPTYQPACGRARETAPPRHPAAAAATCYTLSATLAAADCELDSAMAGRLTGEAAARAAARGATQSATAGTAGWEGQAAAVQTHDPRSGAAEPEPVLRPSVDRAAAERGAVGGRDSATDLLGLPALERRRNHDANGEIVHFALEYCLHVPRRSVSACAESSATTVPILIPLAAYR